MHYNVEFMNIGHAKFSRMIFSKIDRIRNVMMDKSKIIFGRKMVYIFPESAAKIIKANNIRSLRY